MQKEFNYKALSQELLSTDIISHLLVLQENKGMVKAWQKSETSLLDILQKKAIVDDVVCAAISSCSRTMVMNYLVKTSSKSKMKNTTTANYYKFLQKDFYTDKYKTIISKEDIIKVYSRLIQEDKGKKADVLKQRDNNIRVYYRGTVKSTIRTVEAKKIEEYLDSICKSFNEAIKQSRGYEIVIIALFISDLMYAYPFEYYNESIIKIILQMILYRCGYDVVKYVSIQQIIEKMDYTFREELKRSLENRMNPYLDDKHVYYDFLKLLLFIVDNAYENLDNTINSVPETSERKYKRIAPLFDKKKQDGKYIYLTKKEIMNMCPDISQRTIERTLNQLLKEDYIIKLGYTTNTHYQKKDKENKEEK